MTATPITIHLFGFGISEATVAILLGVGEGDLRPLFGTVVMPPRDYCYECGVRMINQAGLERIAAHLGIDIEIATPGAAGAPAAAETQTQPHSAPRPARRPWWQRDLEEDAT